MAMLTPDESRQTDRKRVLKGAKISYAARCASLPCVVRDISSTGARLQVKDHGSVPETFELLIELDGFEAEVEVVWRRQGEVGVIFLDEPVVKNPKRRQVVSSSVPKARGTLRRLKTTGSRRTATVEQTTDAAAASAPLEQTDPQLTTSEDSTDGLVSVDDQVDALTASLQTLEIVAGEDVVTTKAQTHQDAEQLAAEDAAETALAAEAASSDISMEATSSDEQTDEARSLIASNDEPEPSCMNDAVSAVCEDDLIAVEQVEDAPPTDTEAPSNAPQSLDDETQDAPTMDQTFSPLACDTTTDANDETLVESEMTTDDNRDESVATTCVDAAARREVPMFRDPSVDTNVSMIMPETAAQPGEPLEAAQDVIAPTIAEVATAQPVTAPLQSRIETALQAPARAADNLIQPLAPIVPAPVASAAPEEELMTAEPALEPVTEMVAPTFETETSHTTILTSDDPAAAADSQTSSEASAPVAVESDSVVDTSATSSETNAAPVSSTAAMRPELAAFVSMFAAPQARETIAPESVALESPEDGAAEMPAPSEAPGTPRVDNVLAFAAASSEDAATPQFETAPAMTIVEDVIVVDTAPADAPEPTFCEMQVATSTEPEVVDAPVHPTTFEEVLPCADEDDYVAPVSAEADVLQVADVVAVESDASDTLTNMTSKDTSGVENESVAPLATAVEQTEAAAMSAEVPAMPVMTEISETPPAAPEAAHNIPILIAEDDADDRLFMREAFNDSAYHHDIAFVENGEELLAYLNGEGEYVDCPRPGLILLDLNMPKMDGRTALLHIKANPSLRRIPVIVLTTSNSEDDIEKTYDLGVSSYISKPSSAEGLKEIITTLNGYWSNLVALPTRH